MGTLSVRIGTVRKLELSKYYTLYYPETSNLKLRTSNFDSRQHILKGIAIFRTFFGKNQQGAYKVYFRALCELLFAAFA
jgi:hypothetical protein